MENQDTQDCLLGPKQEKNLQLPFLMDIFYYKLESNLKFLQAVRSLVECMKLFIQKKLKKYVKREFLKEVFHGELVPLYSVILDMILV